MSASADKLKAAIDSYKKLATGEIALSMQAFEDVVNIVQIAGGVLERERVIQLALKMEKPITQAEALITKGDSQKGLTADEALAFNLWDACAQERLVFIRDYDPTRVPGRAGSKNPNYPIWQRS